MNPEAQQKPRIMIATPHAGDFSSEYVLRVFWMAKELRQYELTLKVMDSSLIHATRNNMFFEARDAGSDYLLFIDTDMVWPIESLEQMIALGKDVVTGIYVQRYWPHRPTIYMLNDPYILVHIDEFPEEPFRIEAAGCGYMLISRKVLDAFTDEVIQEMGHPFNLAMMPYRIKHGTMLGEDASFCYRLKRLGLELWADPRIKLGHMGSYPYYLHQWEAVRPHLKESGHGTMSYEEILRRKEVAVENHLGSVSAVGGE